MTEVGKEQDDSQTSPFCGIICYTTLLLSSSRIENTIRLEQSYHVAVGGNVSDIVKKTKRWPRLYNLILNR